jgi:hypothetical protein
MKIILKAKDWQILKLNNNCPSKDCHCSNQRCFAN